MSSHPIFISNIRLTQIFGEFTKVNIKEEISKKNIKEGQVAEEEILLKCGTGGQMVVEMMTMLPR